MNTAIFAKIAILIAPIMFFNIQNTNDKTKYEKLWEEVEKLEQKSLPRSALEKVENIYEIALKEKNDKEIIKSTIFKLKYINIIEEDGFVNAIIRLESEIDDLDKIPQAFLRFLLGNMYVQYYNSNSYLINLRSVSYQHELEDIKTWDRTIFEQKIIDNLILSLDEELKNHKITDYPEIIYFNNHDNSELLFPTLYDFFSHSCIQLLNNSYVSVSRYFSFSDTEMINEPEFLSDAETFIKLQIEGDPLSYSYNIIKIFQKWLATRIGDSENDDAYVYADIERLNFAKRVLTSPDKNEMWESELIKLKNKFSGNPALSRINFELAKYYDQLGQSYHPENPVTSAYKYKRSKAHKLLETIVDKFPNSLYYPECQNMKNEIERKTFSFKTEKIAIPNQRVPVKLTYRNVDRLHYTLVKINYHNYNKISRNVVSEHYFTTLFDKGDKIVDRQEISIPTDNIFNPHSVEFLTEKLDKGFYIIIFNYHPEFKVDTNFIVTGEIFVSDLAITARTTNFWDNNSYYVLNRFTGQPVKGAKVDFYINEYDYRTRSYVEKLLYSSYSDENGLAELNTGDENRYYNIKVDVSYKDDFITEQTQFYGRSKREQKAELSVRLFADRAIYRPGQTVHFKGICFDNDGENSKLRKNHKTKVSLYDVNNREISSLDVKSNEFGSFSGSFSIPTDVLTGNFRISCPGGSLNIRVEEYRRPVFEVNLLPVEGQFRINDSVSIEGSAITYAGSPLSGATYRYSIRRSQQWIRFWSFHMPSPVNDEIAHGEGILDENGKFRISFKALGHNPEYDDISRFIFTVEVSVTDINGETQSGSRMVYAANKGLILASDIMGNIDREITDSITVSSTNIAGIHVAAEMEIEIFKLEKNDLLLSGKKWKNTDKKLYTKEQWYELIPGVEFADELDFDKLKTVKSVFKRSINTNETGKIELSGINNWEPGIYRIILKATDKWGNEVIEKNNFTLFSGKSKNMPYKSAVFFQPGINSASPGDVLELFIGSSFNDVFLIYEFTVKGEVSEKQYIKLNNEVKKIEIPIKEEYGGGIAVNLMFVKNGRIYNYTQNTHVDRPRQKLDIELITYRDKTLPGSQEEWRIKISDYLNEPVVAELLAGMYDASLDIFGRNFWNFSYLPQYYTFSFWSESSFNAINSSAYTRNFYPQYIHQRTSIPYFDFFGFSFWGSPHMRYAERRGLMPESAAISTLAGTAEEEKTMFAADKTRDLSTGEPQEQQQQELTEAEEPSQQIQIRTIFDETAFFYPHLVTDKNGEILISFTMPESLTRWNFLGLAHTTDMQIGNIRKEIITQKELMVMPNLPRFFREYDKMEITTTIANVTEEDIPGFVTIEFFEPVSQKNLNELFIKDGIIRQNFVTEKGKNAAVSWEIDIPSGLSMIGVRIIAQGEKHSDGEERIIPVLTNRMMLTESLPLPVRQAGVSKFTMNRLIDSEKSSTLRHHGITLEFTSNPAWYAVQAIPYLMEHPRECSENIFSRLYANLLATHIANSDPKIKRVFELWRDTPGSDALLSNLEKNQELKSLLLEETPWVMQAQNETERKRRIGLLFDLNKMSMETNKAIKQLREQQKYNGGWPWFKGMPESWYITQHIVCGFGKLNKLNVIEYDDPDLKNMISKAVEFIDGELADNYKKLRERCDSDCLKRDNIHHIQIHYLYARSFFIEDFPIAKNTTEAFEYYKDQAEKYWTNKRFYMQGMLAIALNRYGNTKTAHDIMASLKEHALHHEELGMYWKSDLGFFWYQAPIETHALLMEAFDEVTDDLQTVDEMKVWLLKQKQTQDWKTTKATVEAIYALLLRGTDLLSHDDIPVITIGDIIVDPKNDTEIKPEAGTGYFKTSWTKAEIKPEMGNVTVSKETDNVAWGALYWQYFEQLDKITEFEETPLKINKKLFVQRRIDDKQVIVPVEKDENISVGDRITVRIEIRVDRDMEYVHMKDMRAACFEPVNIISGYRYRHGLGYYQSIRDASMNFFIDYLRKGTYVFEYELIVSQKGDFSNGVTIIQSMYAPEFTSHSEGVRVIVK